MDLLSALRRRPFLTPAERGQLDAGLATARRHAGAPMNLIVEERAAGDPTTRAQQLFQAWSLSEADRGLAVLVYACAATRRFAVVAGDEIRRAAPQIFWDSLSRDLARHFEEQRWCDGLFKAVADIAIQLRRHTGPPDPTPPTQETEAH